MDLPHRPPQSRRPPNSPSSQPIFPDEILTEILSHLPVKSLIQMRSVSKFFNSLISDPIFIKMHLHRSTQNPHLTLVSGKSVAEFRLVTVPLTQLLENPLITFPDNPPSFTSSVMDQCWLVGSCNGLLCFAHYSALDHSYRDTWLRVYNPATKILSKRLGYFQDYCKDCRYFFSRYTFGYDNLTRSYKVVALRLIGDGTAMLRTEVKVFRLGDNVWRCIEGFDVAPLRLTLPSENHGVYLNGSLYWLALHNCFNAVRFYDSSGITIDQFVIISLDLGTETHTQLLPPRGFNEVPHVEPTICVLLNCLCFCHDFKQTHFVIWKMEELGVEESWTQLLKVSYQNLQPIVSWLPLHLSQNSNTLLLANKQNCQAIIYNLKDNIVERTTNKGWWIFCKDYVESLVSIS